jgi:hypothetical protein
MEGTRRIAPQRAADCIALLSPGGMTGWIGASIDGRPPSKPVSGGHASERIFDLTAGAVKLVRCMWLDPGSSSGSAPGMHLAFIANAGTPAEFGRSRQVRRMSLIDARTTPGLVTGRWGLPVMRLAQVSLSAQPM